MKSFAKEKLVTKNIQWKESYTEKTEFLKEQFEAVIGAGSYFRFEGKDYGSGDEYYVIIGPAKIHNPRAKFFAGVRKLPATYSAGGKYFDSMDGAAVYARETWGVPTPGSLKPYTSASLYGIADKVEKWKKKQNHKKEVNKNREDKRDRENKKEDKEEGTKMVSFNLKSFIKESMGAERWISRTQREADYNWWSYEDLVNGGDDVWKQVLQTEPNTAKILVDDCLKLKKRVESEVKNDYGIVSPHFFKMYVGYSPSDGGYIVSIGPYISRSPISQESIDRFYIGTKKKRWATPEEIGKTIAGTIARYAEEYGNVVKLDPSDFTYILRKADPEKIMGGSKKDKHQTIGEFSGDQLSKLKDMKQMEGEGSQVALNSKGFTKILAAHPFFKNMVSQIGMSVDQIVADPKSLKQLYNSWVKKYNEAVANGTADQLGMTPPPKFPNALTTNAGQQIWTKINTLGDVKLTQQQKDQLGEAEKNKFQSLSTTSTTDFGFDSLKDALMAASFKYTGLRKYLTQISDAENVTADQLKSLRVSHGGGKTPEVAKTEDIEKELGKLPSKKKTTTEPSKVIEPVTEQPIESTQEITEVPQEPKEKTFKEFEGLFGNALKSLMRISSELDSENKTEAAEEVHEIVRKYIRR